MDGAPAPFRTRPRRAGMAGLLLVLACTAEAQDWSEAMLVEDFPAFNVDPAFNASEGRPAGRFARWASALSRPELADAPRIPEPMVFDLIRPLGAPRGELEINVLNIASFRPNHGQYEWAPEIEYAVFDGFAVEYEIPIEETKVLAQKFAAQYTFGAAFNNAFIHGVQGIAYFDTRHGDFTPTVLYVAGVRFDETWSLLGMFGGSYGAQTFPFSEEPPLTGTDLITNVTLFANATDRLVLGVETNHSRQLRGPAELLVMPQAHFELTRRFTLQIGYGLRDDVEGRRGELAFRVIWER